MTETLRRLRHAALAVALATAVVAAAPAFAAPKKGPAKAAAAQTATLTLGYLDLEDDPRYDPDQMHAQYLTRATGRPLAGAELSLRDGRYATQAAGVTLQLQHLSARDADDRDGLVAAVKTLTGQGARFILADLPGPTLAALAAATRGQDLILFNVAASDDALRQTQCERHVLHTVPNDAMQADALAQYLVERKWRNVLMLQGPSADDQRVGAAFERAAKRFGLKLVDKRPFVLSNDPRQRDLGNVGLLTSGADYDVIYVADADGEFARGVPYRSVRPRPVVGSAGLAGLAWHWTWDRYGAPQLNARFEKGADGRHMTGSDWAAWIAVKSVVEAVQRTGSRDFKTLAAYVRGGDIAIDGFKGNRLSFRPWDQQLRQPLLVADATAVVTRAPIDGFLHPTNTLDTLGFDQADSRCRMP